MDSLRQRFRNEYFSQLANRTKIKENREVNVGDVVLVEDHQKKRVDWPLAKIIEVYEGKSGKVSAVMLKTKDGMLKRPIQRIYPLEITGNDRINICTVKNTGNKWHEYSKDKKKVKNIKGLKFKVSESKKKKFIKPLIRTRSGRISKRPAKFNS